MLSTTLIFGLAIHLIASSSASQVDHLQGNWLEVKGARDNIGKFIEKFGVHFFLNARIFVVESADRRRGFENGQLTRQTITRHTDGDFFILGNNPNGGSYTTVITQAQEMKKPCSFFGVEMYANSEITGSKLVHYVYRSPQDSTPLFKVVREMDNGEMKYSYVCPDGLTAFTKYRKVDMN